MNTMMRSHLDPKVRTERIEKAIEVMGRPEDFTTRWNMDTFGDTKWGSHTPLAPLKCNTACCFAGTLSLDPYFRRRGFAGTWDRMNGGDLGLNPTKSNPSGEWWQGVQDLFGITSDEAGSLVSPNARSLDGEALHARRAAGKGYKITPKRMILRLQALLKRYEDE